VVLFLFLFELEKLACWRESKKKDHPERKEIKRRREKQANKQLPTANTNMD
jgi:hypothetical protein